MIWKICINSEIFFLCLVSCYLVFLPFAIRIPPNPKPSPSRVPLSFWIEIVLFRNKWKKVTYIKLDKILTIYLDNCCFNRPFDDQTQIKIRLETEAKLFIQEKITRNELKLVWSYMLDLENHFNPWSSRKRGSRPSLMVLLIRNLT